MRRYRDALRMPPNLLAIFAGAIRPAPGTITLIGGPFAGHWWRKLREGEPFTGPLATPFRPVKFLEYGL